MTIQSFEAPITTLEPKPSVTLFGHPFLLDTFYKFEPENRLSEEGIQRLFLGIQNIVKRHNPDAKLHANTLRIQWVAFVFKNPFSETVSILRNNRVNMMRFSKGIEEFLRKEHGIKLSAEDKRDIGNRLNMTKVAPCLFKITNRFNWRAGDFGDGGSCYFNDRTNARNVIREEGGFAIQVFDVETKRGYGRAWFFPHHKQNPDIIAMFNGYGKGGLHEHSSLLCDFLNAAIPSLKLSTTSTSMTVNGMQTDLIYINSGRTSVIYDTLKTKAISDEIEFRFSYVWGECAHCKENFDPDDMYKTIDGKLLCEDCIGVAPYTYANNYGNYVPNAWIIRRNEEIDVVLLLRQNQVRYITSSFAQDPEREPEIPKDTIYCEWTNSHWRKDRMLIVNGRFTSPEALCCTRVCRACFQRYFIEESFSQSEIVCDSCYGHHAMPAQMPIENVMKAFLNGKPARNRHNTLFTDGLTLWSSAEDLDVVIASRSESSYRDRLGETHDRIRSFHQEAFDYQGRYVRDTEWTTPVNIINHSARFNTIANAQQAELGYHYAAVRGEWYIIGNNEQKYVIPTNEYTLKSERQSFRLSRRLHPVQGVSDEQLEEN